MENSWKSQGIPSLLETRNPYILCLFLLLAFAIVLIVSIAPFIFCSFQGFFVHFALLLLLFTFLYTFVLLFCCPCFFLVHFIVFLAVFVCFDVLFFFLFIFAFVYFTNFCLNGQL